MNACPRCGSPARLVIPSRTDHVPKPPTAECSQAKCGWRGDVKQLAKVADKDDQHRGVEPTERVR